MERIRARIVYLKRLGARVCNPPQMNLEVGRIARFQTRRGFGYSMRFDRFDAAADLEIGDTPGLETWATFKAARRMKRRLTLTVQTRDQVIG